MRFLVRSLLLAWIAATTLLAMPAFDSASAQERIGNAVSVTNQVERSRGGVMSPLMMGGDVYQNEQVRTGAASLARLAFLDNTSLNIGPSSLVTLDRFVYNPSRTAGSMVVRATQGTLRFVTGSQRPQNYVIQTPIASIGVRGTVFDLYVGSDRIVATLVEGRIIVTPIGGGPITVSQPGTSVTVYANGTFVRRADWRGVTQPDYATLFGTTQVAGLPTPFSTRYPGAFTFGVTVGGAFLTDLPTSSGDPILYKGNVVGTPTAFLAGAQIFMDLGSLGPLGVSVGAMADFIGGSRMEWNGTCGGVFCDGSGFMSEVNVLGVVKVSTPLGAGLSANVYAGAGFALLMPEGLPIGFGPEFRDTQYVPAVRLGVGLEQRLSDFVSVGFTTGVQFTGEADFATQVPIISFHIDQKTEVTWGLTFNFHP